MKFSIIIPVYNSEKFLDECLHSILSQPFADYEVICADDGSTDGSLQMIDQYVASDSRVLKLSLNHGGAAAARNSALDIAHGEYVLFVDADDSLAEGALQILDAAVGSGIFDIVAFNFQRYYESRNTTDFGTGLWTAEFKSGWYYFCDVAGKMAPGTFGCVCGRAYSRRLYSELRFDVGLRYHEDLLFAVSACERSGAVKMIQDVLYVYRIRESGSVMSTIGERRYFDMVRLANTLSGRFISKQGITKDTIYRMIASYYRNSLLWSTPVCRGDIRRMIDWDAFRKVSGCDIKLYFAYLMLRAFPDMSVKVINRFRR